MMKMEGCDGRSEVENPGSPAIVFPGLYSFGLTFEDGEWEEELCDFEWLAVIPMFNCFLS